MKAIYCAKYGSIDRLVPKEVPAPTPDAGEVLVRVRASSVNYNSLVYMLGRPLFARMKTGLFRPKVRIPGSDVAGVVDAVGAGVTGLRPGDKVFGEIGSVGFGAFAEFVCAPEQALALKPANITFEEAAAAPQAALVALQALRTIGRVQPGQDVLIYGASGGIGTFAVQIAKAYGAEVTGVCSTDNLGMVRALGAAHVVDYTKEDFLQTGRKYDLIVATAGYRPIEDFEQALKPQGIYVVTGGTMRGKNAMRPIIEAGIKGPRLSKAGGKKLCILTCKVNREDLLLIRELLESGKVKPVIDRCCSLEEVPEALRYYLQGHSRGKVVIRI